MSSKFKTPISEEGEAREDHVVPTIHLCIWFQHVSQNIPCLSPQASDIQTTDTMCYICTGSHLTLTEKTMAAIPRGKKQKIVVKIDRAR